MKEMFIVRYADDFRIFCRTKNAAARTKIAVTQWLMKRLKLEVSEEKTKIINVKRRYSEFLGFKIKVHPKAGKQVVTSHICDKRLRVEREKLVGQAKQIASPHHGKTELDEIRIYNSTAGDAPRLDAECGDFRGMRQQRGTGVVHPSRTAFWMEKSETAGCHRISGVAAFYSRRASDFLLYW